MILLIISTIKRKENAKLKKKFKEIFVVLSKVVKNLTGFIKSSENSLNQHIKLKHPELWDKLKTVDINQQSYSVEFKNIPILIIF